MEAHSTILYAGVRPEFRGAIACFLASTSKENRARFAEARLNPDGPVSTRSTLREYCEHPARGLRVPGVSTQSTLCRVLPRVGVARELPASNGTTLCLMLVPDAST